MKPDKPIDKFYEIPCPCFTALLADFHNTDPEPVLMSLRSQKPDVILIAGDIVFSTPPKDNRLQIHDNRNAIDFLRACSGIAPTFFSLGNHEFMLCKGDLEVISSTGVTLLDNSWTSHNGLVIGGLSSAHFTLYQDFRSRQSGDKLYPKPLKYILSHKNPPELSWLGEFERQDGYKILLCHHPEYYPPYLRGRKIDLICAGHCHGGQWRFYSPVHKETRGVYAPGQGLFPALTSGIHDGRLLISQGVSNPVRVPRINNPTEIVYFGLRQ